MKIHIGMVNKSIMASINWIRSTSLFCSSFQLNQTHSLRYHFSDGCSTHKSCWWAWPGMYPTWHSLASSSRLFKARNQPKAGSMHTKVGLHVDWLVGTMRLDEWNHIGDIVMDNTQLFRALHFANGGWQWALEMIEAHIKHGHPWCCCYSCCYRWYDIWPLWASETWVLSFHHTSRILITWEPLIINLAFGKMTSSACKAGG